MTHDQLNNLNQETTMQPFTPTHRITESTGESFEVMLIDGAAYTMAEWNANAQSDYEADTAGSWTFQGRPVTTKIEQLYRIAFVKADGSWDVVESFSEHSDFYANEYAERHYADKEWYVLDASGNNING